MTSSPRLPGRGPARAAYDEMPHSREYTARADEWSEKGAATIVKQQVDAAGNTSTVVVKKGVKDFHFGNVLGEGSYSTVVLATDKSTSKQYAVKILDKRHIIKEKKVKYVTIEKNTLNRLGNHPGIVKLFYTFQDEASLYFVLEYSPNGELLSLIKELGSLSESCTRYYGVQLLDAIRFMHSRGVVHRDLKPENILLDAKFRIVITDFGTAKLLDPLPDSEPGKPRYPIDEVRASSFVGTAEYVSPELLSEKVCGKACDIWAYGCIIYQLIAGKPPFKAPNEYLIFQKITKLQYAYPPRFPALIRDLLKHILVLNPRQRYTVGHIQQHPFFHGVNWRDSKAIWNSYPPELRSFVPSSNSVSASTSALPLPSAGSSSGLRAANPRVHAAPRPASANPGVSSSINGGMRPQSGAARNAGNATHKKPPRSAGSSAAAAALLALAKKPEEIIHDVNVGGTTSSHSAADEHVPLSEYVSGSSGMRSTLRSVGSYGASGGARKSSEARRSSEQIRTRGSPYLPVLQPPLPPTPPPPPPPPHDSELPPLPPPRRPAADVLSALQPPSVPGGSGSDFSMNSRVESLPASTDDIPTLERLSMQAGAQEESGDAGGVGTVKSSEAEAEAAVDSLAPREFLNDVPKPEVVRTTTRNVPSMTYADIQLSTLLTSVNERILKYGIVYAMPYLPTDAPEGATLGVRAPTNTTTSGPSDGANEAESEQTGSREKRFLRGLSRSNSGMGSLKLKRANTGGAPLKKTLTGNNSSSSLTSGSGSGSLVSAVEDEQEDSVAVAEANDQISGMQGSRMAAVVLYNVFDSEDRKRSDGKEGGRSRFKRMMKLGSSHNYENADIRQMSAQAVRHSILHEWEHRYLKVKARRLLAVTSFGRIILCSPSELKTFEGLGNVQSGVGSNSVTKNDSLNSKSRYTSSVALLASTLAVASSSKSSSNSALAAKTEGEDAFKIVVNICHPRVQIKRPTIPKRKQLRHSAGETSSVAIVGTFTIATPNLLIDVEIPDPNEASKRIDTHGGASQSATGSELMTWVSALTKSLEMETERLKRL